MKRRADIRGFTLIEVMVVVVIVGLLAMVGYPSYTQHVLRTQRTAAQQFLMDAANRQEQFLMNSRQYATTVAQLYGVANASSVIPSDVGSRYTIAVGGNPTGTPPTYTITATAIAGSKQASDKQSGTACNVLVINQAGTKTPAACW